MPCSLIEAESSSRVACGEGPAGLEAGGHEPVYRNARQNRTVPRGTPRPSLPGRSAERPRPRACFFAPSIAVSEAFPAQVFARQGEIGLGPLRLDVVGQDGFAERGGLPQADVAWNHGAIDAAAEVFPDVVSDLPGEVSAVVEHGQDDSVQGQGRIEAPPHAVDRFHELRKALQGEVLRLDGHEDRVGRGQGIERQKRQGGRAVQKDDVEFGFHGGERLPQPAFSVRLFHELDLGPDEIARRGQERQVGKQRRTDGSSGRLAEQYAVSVDPVVLASLPQA